MNIHIKEPYQQPRELTLEQAQLQLQNGTLSPDALAWQPGLSEWVPILSLPEISPAVPPALPKESKKTSKKAIGAFLLVFLGILTASTGIGILLILAGIIVGVFASRDFKKHGDNYRGYGWLTAAQILVIILGGIVTISFLSLFVPACQKALEKRKHTVVSSNSDVQTSHADAVSNSETTKNKKITGSSTAYTYSVPSAWTINTPVKPADSFVTSENVAAVVIVEKKQYADAKEVCDIYKSNIKNAYNATDPQWLTQDGQRWCAFSFMTKEEGQEALWIAFIHTGTRGTIRFSFISKNPPFKSDLATFRGIFETFRFPGE